MPVGRAHQFHRHPTLEEIIYVISGTAEQWVDREQRTLRAGESAHIPQNVVHGTYNAGDDPLVFLAILSPATFSGPAIIEVHTEEPWRSLKRRCAAGVKSILLIGTFDTKGEEYGFVRAIIRARGFEVLSLDVGVLGTEEGPRSRSTFPQNRWRKPGAFRWPSSGHAGTAGRRSSDAGRCASAHARALRGATLQRRAGTGRRRRYDDDHGCHA
jgi:hypothetical protein